VLAFVGFDGLCGFEGGRGKGGWDACRTVSTWVKQSFFIVCEASVCW